MTTYREATQIRTSLKMKLSAYSWYCSSGVFMEDNDYYIKIYVKKIDNEVRKIIPPVLEGINVKTEVDKTF